MTIVYVKHYLNEIGRDYFNAHWFPQVQSLISQQNGFLDITSFQDNNDFECINIIVKFDSDENLYALARSSSHQQVINNLEPYRTKLQRWFISDGSIVPPLAINEWESLSG